MEGLDLSHNHLSGEIVTPLILMTTIFLSLTLSILASLAFPLFLAFLLYSVPWKALMCIKVVRPSKLGRAMVC